MNVERVKKNIQHLIGLCLVMKYGQETTNEDDTLVLIGYAAEEFGHNLKSFKVGELSKLNNLILKKGKEDNTILTSRQEHPYMELNASGLISLMHCWTEFFYEGTTLSSRKATVLRINGQDYHSKYLTPEEDQQLADSIATLFDVEVKRRISSRDKVGAIYDVFTSARMNNPIRGYSLLMDIANDMDDYEDMDGKEQRRTKENHCNMIINQYLEYLWEKYRKKTDPQYILSFESFMERHREAWIAGRNAPKEALNLFTEEHMTIVEMFKSLKESKVIYQCERRYPSRRGLPQETTTSGRGGL